MDLKQCYARLVEGELIVGNRLFERRWRVDGDRLRPVSLLDKIARREWIAHAGKTVAPTASAGTGAGRSPRLTIRRGSHSPVSQPCLLGTLKFAAAAYEVTWQFRVWPDAAGVMMQLLECAGTAASDALAAPAADAEATGIELEHAPPGALPTSDAMELFAAAGNHLRLRQVVLVDQTDTHNELVFENEWLLHPNEANLALQGNLFVLEDVLSGSGLVFVKHAPLPHARPLPCEADLRVTGTPACFYGDRSQPTKSECWPLSYRVGLYGHGSDGGDGYAWTTLCYSGGEFGRIAALQQYQRQIRPYVSGRDGLFISNTWGDRSRDGRINEEFLLKEIDAGAALGVDAVQIDDGWQRGRTSNSVRSGGVWEGFWASDGDFWQPCPHRLPRGLAPLAAQAKRHGLSFGLWFAPDSSSDFANWHRDAQAVLELHRRHNVRLFKIDGVKARTRTGERNLRRFFDEVLKGSRGRVVFDLDVTAEVRPGYLGMIDVGPVFVENRYSDFRRYWPHQTLRNLWKLASHVDPLRLRMELLNNSRNGDLYGDDPLAPSRYDADYLLATTIMASPLGWFETSNLPPEFVKQAAPLAKVWKKHRDAIFSGRIWPIGEAPDGRSWTGFFTLDADERGGFALVFRELNPAAEATLALPPLPRQRWRCRRLAGEGDAEIAAGRIIATIPAQLRFLLVRFSR